MTSPLLDLLIGPAQPDAIETAWQEANLAVAQAEHELGRLLRDAPDRQPAIVEARTVVRAAWHRRRLCRRAWVLDRYPNPELPPNPALEAVHATYQIQPFAVHSRAVAATILQAAAPPMWTYRIDFGLGDSEVIWEVLIDQGVIHGQDPAEVAGRLAAVFNDIVPGSVVRLEDRPAW